MTKEKSVAIAIGGSIIAPEYPDLEFIKNLAQKIFDCSKKQKLFIVIGGGYQAKVSIKIGRYKNIPEEELDKIGIKATRENAKTFISVLKDIEADVNSEIPHTTDQAIEMLKDHSIVVMGGTTPGHSTDFVAAELAYLGGCVRLVVATNVHGVHERDPKENPDSKHITKLTFQELIDIIGTSDWTAGSHGVLDAPSAKLIAQHAILTNVVHGHNIDNLILAIEGKEFLGTRISNNKPTK